MHLPQVVNKNVHNAMGQQPKVRNGFSIPENIVIGEFASFLIHSLEEIPFNTTPDKEVHSA